MSYKSKFGDRAELNRRLAEDALAPRHKNNPATEPLSRTASEPIDPWAVPIVELKRCPDCGMVTCPCHPCRCKEE